MAAPEALRSYYGSTALQLTKATSRKQLAHARCSRTRGLAFRDAGLRADRREHGAPLGLRLAGGTVILGGCYVFFFVEGACRGLLFLREAKANS